MSTYKWHFFRAGGFDQVSIETGADLMALPELDQKLWVALSCPVTNLELDAKTLELLDSDRDGHIRVPEIVEAVRWAASYLKDPHTLVDGRDGILLSAINDETEEGKLLAASAREILINLGKGDAEVITTEDTANEEAILAQMRFNGDGIIPADVTDDPVVSAVIADIIDCLGAETDRSGKPGVSQEKVDRFFAQGQAYTEWQAIAQEDPSLLILGERTQAAIEVLSTVKDKVDDYFTRCKLAEFDERSATPLNPSAEDYQKLALLNLSTSTESFASFPLALVEQKRPLPLTKCINPAWAQYMTRLREEVIRPILGEKESITEDEWRTVNAGYANYIVWCAARPATSVEKLGLMRITEVLDGGFRGEIEALIAEDKALESEANAISSVDKLVRYCRYLHTLVNNFAAFRDFYSSRSKAVFQAGTLYLDGRSCELCVKVDDIASHAVLATLSRVYLVYCNCTRCGGSEKMTIAAAITAGDSDQLILGRNGVFYDRSGRDWDATVARIIDHPINIRQAFWAPYKQASRLIGEQLTKIAAARSKAAEQKVVTVAIQQGAKAAAPPAEKAFDVGKFAGIFAAVGLAVGAIGTAIASVITGLLRLAWWQLPIAVLGFLLLISGPSMFIAWFKLRQRNLGPILDANGWAVNTRAKINITFGKSLTSVAKLPEGAEKPLRDPYADKKSPWGFYLFLITMIIAFLLIWKLGFVCKWLGWTC
ncbi:MAG: hypothetical protein PHN75_00820 [Syntrophales bacterium]|nr:hypothetical protein [Syntrophales bacterium]